MPLTPAGSLSKSSWWATVGSRLLDELHSWPDPIGPFY